jgi:hypothetical protein
MILDLPENLETALKVQANARGVSPAGYVFEVLQRELDATVPNTAAAPFTSGYGTFAKFGPAPSAEEIDANRADMFGGFGESFI